MKKATLLILTAAVVVIFAAYFILFYTPQNSTQDSEHIQVLSLQQADITAMTATANEGWSLVLTGDGWQSADDENFPLNTQYVQSLINYFLPLTATLKVVESTDDTAQYGLDEPQNIITATAAGATYEMAFGDTSILTGETYMQITGDESVYMVDTQLVVDFDVHLHDMMILDEWPITSPSQILDVTWEHALDTTQMLTDTTLTATRHEDASVPVEYTATTFDGEQYVPNSDDAIVILSAISSVYITNCIDYNASADELFQYGLDEPSSTITITSTLDEQLITTVLYVGNTSADGHYYVRINDSTAVNLMDGMILSGVVNPVLNRA